MTLFYALLPDFSGQHVALLPKGEKFGLPQFVREDGARFNTVATINEAITSTWHVPVSVAYCIAAGENGEQAAYAMHNHDKSWLLPAPAKWVDLEDLKNLVFDSAEERAVVASFLASEEDVVWKNLPWSAPDWLARATEWINKSVAATGATVTGAPEQVRAWAISCILRVPTTKGTVFFKALPEFFGHEAVLARYLMETFPQYMVDVIAIEPQQHWMLSKEWVGAPPKSKQEWQKTLSALIEIQMHCNDKVDKLYSFGCHNRELASLPTLLEPVLDELKQESMRTFYGVNAEEALEVSRRIKELPELCERLSACGISDTLLHGDLWSSNVIFRDEFSGKSPIIFDWTHLPQKKMKLCAQN